MLRYMPSAVVFDMDGLIFDTEVLYQQAFMEAAREVRHDVPLALMQGAIGVPWAQNKLSFLQQMGPDFPVDQYGDAVMRYFETLASKQLRLKPGVVELLDVLDKLVLPRCIATSSSHATVQKHLSAHRLQGRFDAIIAHGDYAAGKPSPDPFRVAARRLQVEPDQCLALEDSFNGVRSASSAGMMTFMVPDIYKPTPEIRSLCTGVVTDLHVICDLLLGASTTCPTSR
ncbi:Haloacid dehalogenase superfamily protein, subfamily IA, variant 3 with third motif having DD or ED [Agrobacterium sp. NCPPB 925]|nr:Haloacid dehalogenase superfamily protein, subfamily IA, variant 3 with third motif having DD or ED [Agrobacterium sp. NCPPB 925]